MNSQYLPEMYQDFGPNRMSGRTSQNNYNPLHNTLHRQPSRQFEHYPQGDSHIFNQERSTRLYTPENNGNDFETDARTDSRMFASTLQPTHTPDYSQTWGPFSNGANTMSSTSRMRAPGARRPQIPNAWYDNSQTSSIPSIQTSYANGQYGTQAHLQSARVSPPNEEELIPTAIVIKNIPFAVKKEQLVAAMTEMGLPLPYAFNYHFDSGVFRGLAFANFTTAQETEIVIKTMNHMDIAGRKLRVEYKKMLPLAERDRIERDKRERRGQLQEQHQPMGNSGLHHQASMSSMNSGPPTTSPSPVHTRSEHLPFNGEVDMNDPMTLSLFGELTVFKRDLSQRIMTFPKDLSPTYRRVVHTLCHHMELYHWATGVHPNRVLTVSKDAGPPSPPQQSQLGYYNDPQRRGLNRAATIDFAEARQNEAAAYNNHTLGRQASALLDIPGSPGLNGHAANLRGVKSFADLRSFSPSPVPTTASYPVNQGQNHSRYGEYGQAPGSVGTPSLTPTSSNNAGASRDESFLLHGLGNLSLGGYDRSVASRSNGRLQGQSDTDSPVSTAGPIGSQRPTNGQFDDSQRNGASTTGKRQPIERQPKGPSASDWGAGAGFSRPRQNGHTNQGSGDSSDRSGVLASSTRYMS